MDRDMSFLTESFASFYDGLGAVEGVSVIPLIREAYVHGVYDALADDIEDGHVTEEDIEEMASLFIADFLGMESPGESIDDLMEFNEFLDSDD